MGRMTNAPVGGRVHEWTRGDRLRAAREGMPSRPNHVQFAKLMGISRNTVARYESNTPGADKPIVLMRWAEVTGYDPAWLSGAELEDKVTISECYSGLPARSDAAMAPAA